MSQNIYTATGTLFADGLDMTSALRELHRLAGSKGSLTVGGGRINAYVVEFQYGKDNSGSLVAYAEAVT